jgi:hypothetical protein
MMRSGSHRASHRISRTAAGVIIGSDTTEWICHISGRLASRAASPATTHARKEFVWTRTAFSRLNRRARRHTYDDAAAARAGLTGDQTRICSWRMRPSVDGNDSTSTG